MTCARCWTAQHIYRAGLCRACWRASPDLRAAWQFRDRYPAAYTETLAAVLDDARDRYPRKGA